jgi:predicted DNA-binding protein (MmcQ/YjbR family)
MRSRTQELRAEYESISTGFIWIKKHWNTVLVNKEVSDALVKELIDHSYELVFKSLTKENKLVFKQTAYLCTIPFVDTQVERS